MARRASALLIGGLLAASITTAAPVSFTPPQRDYILACAGCHGFAGVSNPQLVPSLAGLVGYFLNFPEGRAYLPRLPNVAFSDLSDAQLAAVLNYLVFDIGGNSAPSGTPPYRSEEVGRLRRQPLTEVSLTEYRGRLVQDLIDRYGAPQALRGYGYPGGS